MSSVDWWHDTLILFLLVSPLPHRSIGWPHRCVWLSECYLLVTRQQPETVGSFVCRGFAAYFAEFPFESRAHGIMLHSDHSPTFPLATPPPLLPVPDTSTPRIRAGLLLQMLMAWKHATMLKNNLFYMHHDVRLVILWMTHLGPLALANVTLKLFVQWGLQLACDPWSPYVHSGWRLWALETFPPHGSSVADIRVHQGPECIRCRDRGILLERRAPSRDLMRLPRRMR